MFPHSTLVDAMKNSLIMILSVALIGAGSPALVFAQDGDDSQDSAGADPGEELSAEERARRVEELAAAGANDYRQGNYESAIRNFKQAYALEPVPNLLYNIAKCYEKQEKYPEAVDYYQEFVVAPEVDSTARKAALDRIDSLREIAQLKRDRDRDDRSSSSRERSEQRETRPAPEPEKPLNMPAIYTLGGSVVLLAGGLTMGYLASSKTDTITDSNASFDERHDAQSSARTFALVADGMFIAAAAAAGVGLYLFFSGDDSDTPASASRQQDAGPLVTPWVNSEGAGLGMSLGF